MPDKYPEIYVPFVASILLGLILIGFVVTIFQLYKKKKLLQEKEVTALKTEYEKDLLQTRLEIQEDILKNISMEIHDNIGQVMLLANVNVSLIQALEMPPGAPELIKETKVLLCKAIEDISQLSRSLHSDRITDIGVFNAIEHELFQLQEKGLYKVAIDNRLEIQQRALPKESQLVIFRMYQEIIKNILKHANATQIQLTVIKNHVTIEMEINDNGTGFVQGGASENGVGLRSLRSRIALIKGRIEIDSTLDMGTSIRIFIPVAEKLV